MALSRLQKLFILPFLCLVAALALTIGWVAYRVGQDIVDTLSQKVLLEIASRINQATERHLLTSQIALKAVVPDTPVTTAPVAGGNTKSRFEFADDARQIEERLWIATGLFPSTNRYVYFGGTDGAFIGVNRVRSDRVELRLNKPGSVHRDVYSMKGPHEQESLLRTDRYEARERPWYKSVDLRRGATWSPVYIDFTTHEPVLTLAKPVLAADQTLRGITATDVSLKGLTDFLETLEISQNGVAFIVERSGELIASSANELPFRLEGQVAVRMKASESNSAVVRRAYSEVLQQLHGDKSARSPINFQFESEVGVIQAVATQLRDEAGLNWISVVAVPRPDFMGGIKAGIYQSVTVGVMAVFVVVMLGLMLLQRALGDIRKLAHAARSVGTGAPYATPGVERDDEIGDLANSLAKMEKSLRTDRLTQLLNRESFLAQIEFRRRHASPVHPLRFAVLFVDLDHFKMINDRHGHQAGDITLIEVARRLQYLLRDDDAVARYGGDEFIVYLHAIDNEKNVRAVCEKIHWTLDAPVRVGSGTVHIGCSIGAAIYPGDGSELGALIKVAKDRMAQAKTADIADRPRSVVGG